MMTLIKKILLTVLVVLSASFYLFAQQPINKLDTNLLKQGPYKKYYPNGKLRYEGQFKDDKPYGLFKYYYESGELKTTLLFSENGKKAYATNFYQNGKKWSEGIYLNEKKDSIWKFYDIYGKIQSEEAYKLGVKDGTSIIYYDDGKAASVTNFKNGKKHGEAIEYFPSGKVKLKANYLEDELDGNYEINHTNEIPYKVGKYKKSLPVGWWATYTPEGIIQVREFFVNGIQKKIEYLNGKFEDYYPSQIPKEIITYKDGKKNGPFTEFYDIGTFKKIERVDEQNGEKNIYEYLEGQVPKRKGTYVDDKLDGEIIYFDTAGKIIKKEVYKNGIKQ